MIGLRRGAVGALLAALACAPASAQAPGSGQTAPAQSNSAQSTSALPPAGLIAGQQGDAPGYQHGPEHSHFAFTGETRTVQEYGYARRTGSNGVFATNLHTGMVIAVPNANARPAPPPAGFAPDPERHSDAVLAYFRSAGLPRDQIHGMHVLTQLSLSGRTDEARTATPHIDGYTTVIEREVEGIPVPDSFAAAQLDPVGNVVAEWVYWPPIPASAITAARQMQAAMAEPSRRQAFLARLPANLPAGQVVIRHSSGSTAEPFQAVASYDVLERLTSGGGPAIPGMRVAPPRTTTVVRHYGSDGAELRLPQETRRPLQTLAPQQPTTR